MDKIMKIKIQFYRLQKILLFSLTTTILVLVIYVITFNISFLLNYPLTQRENAKLLCYFWTLILLLASIIKLYGLTLDPEDKKLDKTKLKKIFFATPLIFLCGIIGVLLASACFEAESYVLLKNFYQLSNPIVLMIVISLIVFDFFLAYRALKLTSK